MLQYQKTGQEKAHRHDKQGMSPAASNNDRGRGRKDDDDATPPNGVGTATATGSDPDLCGRCKKPMVPGRRYCPTCGWDRHPERGGPETSKSSSSEYSTSDESALSGQGSGRREKAAENIQCPSCMMRVKVKNRYCGCCGFDMDKAKGKSTMSPIVEDGEMRDEGHVAQGSRTNASKFAGMDPTREGKADTAGESSAKSESEPESVEAATAKVAPNGAKVRYFDDETGDEIRFVNMTRGVPVMGTPVPPQEDQGDKEARQEKAKDNRAGGQSSDEGAAGPAASHNERAQGSGTGAASSGLGRDRNVEQEAGRPSMPGHEGAATCRGDGDARNKRKGAGCGLESSSDNSSHGAESERGGAARRPGPTVEYCRYPSDEYCYIDGGCAYHKVRWMVGSANPQGVGRGDRNGANDAGVNAATPTYANQACGTNNVNGVPYPAQPYGGVPPPVYEFDHRGNMLRSEFCRGRDLTFKGIPTKGEMFALWKSSVISDVVRAANLRNLAIAQEYIEMAFNPKATAEHLRNIPHEFVQLHAMVSHQVMHGRKAAKRLSNMGWKLPLGQAR